jgi:DNA polymerase-2
MTLPAMPPITSLSSTKANSFEEIKQKHGFILTRQTRDIKSGILITLWLKTPSGPVKLEITDELALFFVENEQAEQAKKLLLSANIACQKVAELPLKTFNQQHVHGFYFRYLRDFYRARDCLKLHGIKCFEDDFRPDDRYLMERFITSNVEFIGDEHISVLCKEEVFLDEKSLKKALKKDKNNDAEKEEQVKALVVNELAVNDLVADASAVDGSIVLYHEQALYQPYRYFDQVKCKASKNQVPLTMLSIDIECSMDGDLYSIGLYTTDFQKVLMIGEPPEPLTPLSTESLIKPSMESKNSSNDYILWLADELELLKSFLYWVGQTDADLLIGWNVINFDMDLLQKRFDKYHLKFSIGRDNSAPYWRKNKNTDQKYLEIAGRVVLDGIDLLKTATYSFPSFSLDNVANTLLGIGKKVDDVDNRLHEITQNFYHNKEALAAYNLEDCRLVWLIFEKTQLLEFAMLRSTLTGLSIDRVGGSVAAFTNLYLPKLHRSGYIAPNMGDGQSDLISPGGYVMDSIPGLYENVLVLDFKSLYPSIIRTFKIDPMGLIEGLNDKKNAENADEHLIERCIEGFDGAYFSRSKHFLPDIIESLWLERDKAKKEKNAALSQAIKIIMNSFYGVLGSTGCRFFDPRLSGSITKRSHELLKVTKTWIEEQGYTVIYGDTDSIFVHAGKELSLEQSRALGVKLQNSINQRWQEKLQQDFKVESQLEIEFETHFSKFLMPTIRGLDIGTKKRYAGLVIDDKTSKQTLIFKGLESVRTDWTELAKGFQRTLYDKVFNDQPVDSYIREMVAKTLAGDFDDKLMYRKRLRRNIEDYVKNVPPQVKAARLADKLNKAQGKALKYQNRGWVEYFITLNGPQTKQHLNAILDYQFYIDRQLEAVADGILPFIGKSFDNIVNSQLSLFD